MIIKKVIEKFPKTAEIFMSYGLQCVSCQFAIYESIEEGLKSQGMTHEMKKILNDLNKVAKER